MKNTKKTYILNFREVNTHNQVSLRTITFKASSLDELSKILEHYHSCAEPPLPETIVKERFKQPKNFAEAGGFAQDTQSLTFICKETNENLRDWYRTEGWG